MPPLDASISKVKGSGVKPRQIVSNLLCLLPVLLTNGKIKTRACLFSKHCALPTQPCGMRRQIRAGKKKAKQRNYWLPPRLVSVPPFVAVSVATLPPVPKPAPTPPVPAAPEFVVIFFVVSLAESVCPVAVLLSEQLHNQTTRPPKRKIRFIFTFFY